MAQLVVRNLDDDVKAKLQKRARKHGHSTEQEVRNILQDAVKQGSEPDLPLGTRIASRFAGLGFKPGEIKELRGQPVRPARFRK